MGVEVHQDPFGLYARASQELSGSTGTVLLETRDAELDARRSRIPSSQDLRHVMVLRTAVRLEGRGSRVDLIAESETGRDLLQRLEGPGLVSQGPELSVFESPSPTPSADEDARLTEPSSLDALRLILGELDVADDELAPSLVLLTSHELMERFEPTIAAVRTAAGERSEPDYVAFVPEISLEVFEGRGLIRRLVLGSDLEEPRADLRRTAQLAEQVHPFEVSPPPSLSYSVDVSDERYAEGVQRCRAHILDGDAYQIVLSRSFSGRCNSPRDGYARLRQTCPSPYGFLVEADDFSLFGSSPETAVKVTDGDVEVSPIAGTRPRGQRDGVLDADLDARFEAELRQDEKENAEHLMLVDLARNDVARVAERGRTRVERLLTVARFSQVMHLVSEVRGRLRSDMDALHALRATLNPGTLVGAPKIRAAQILGSLEANRRGFYGGAIALFRSAREMDSAIIIRSAVVRDGQAIVRAGAGIVADSDPWLEAQETRSKAANVLHALGLSEGAGA